ncbi:MAG: hypothetical protein AAB564_02505 [Patescibacteria group bacterium]
MKLMTRFGKLAVVGVILFIAVGYLLVVVFDMISTDFLNPVERQMKKDMRKAATENEIVVANATEALRSVVDVANELSVVKTGMVFNFEAVGADGRSANFGVVQHVNEVKGERIVEEHMVVFNQVGTAYNSEVDRNTHAVVAMHREPQYSPYQASQEELENIARQFLKKIGSSPDQYGSVINFSANHKASSEDKWGNWFFRWDDKQFAVPAGLDMDIPPFIQVGITASGFIFSYDNTVQLYHNLSKEDLRTLCGFVEMPQSDDSSLDPEKGIVKVYFSEYEPFQNKYLVLPFEPETDFDGCSEFAKSFLKHIQETVIPPEKEAVFCTQEAKLCPDGSYVGRTRPNCEFALCPGE